MRLDHLAYRVTDREGTVAFFEQAFGYKRQTEFDIALEDGSTAKCMALQPPEKILENIGFFCISYVPVGPMVPHQKIDYHLAPEIFVTASTPGGVVDKWIKDWTGGRGGLHHIAYQVDSVRETMQLWLEKGWAEFTTPDPLTCDDLTQVFTKPNPFTGVIYEFIERKGQHGFCKDNVARLIDSTKGIN